MALFDKTTIGAAVDTGPRASRTDVDKLFLTALFNDAEKGLFSTLGNTYPELHWDTTRRAFLWGQGVNTAPDLYLQRQSASYLELIDAANTTHQGIHIGNTKFTEVSTPATPAANQAAFYAKDFGGITQPYWLDSAGQETPLLLFSTLNVFNTVDYGADPTGASVSTLEIQAAIDAAEAAGGGIVYSPSGTYLVDPTVGAVADVPLTIEGSNIWFTGAGTGQTTFKLVNNASLTNSLQMIYVRGWLAPGARASNVRIMDFSVDGNASNQTYTGKDSVSAVHMAQCERSSIERVYLHDWLGNYQQGVTVEGTGIILNDSLHSFIKDCFVSDATDSVGIQIGGQTKTGSKWNTIDNCYVKDVTGGATSGGIALWQGTENGVRNNVVEGVGVGIHIEDALGSLVLGNKVDSTVKSGIQLTESVDGVCSGNIVRNPGQGDSGANACGINVFGLTAGGGGATGWLISNNRIYDDQTGAETMDYGIYEQQDADYNTLQNNTITGAAIQDVRPLGANTVYSGNVNPLAATYATNMPMQLTRESDNSGGVPTLEVGASSPGSGENYALMLNGYTSNLHAQELNSANWVLSNNAHYNETTWVPDATGTVASSFQMVGRSFQFYTAPAQGGGSWPGWVHHMSMLGSQDGKLYIGDAATAPSWIDDGEGLAIEHEDASDKAWFQTQGEDTGEFTMVKYGPFTIGNTSFVRFAAADIPDHGFVRLIGGDVNQSLMAFYDLGHATQSQTSIMAGGTISLDGNVARNTGTSGATNSINIGCSAGGFDVENRAGGAITFSIHFEGHG